MLYNTFLWFVSLALTHKVLSWDSHDTPRIQNALFQFGTGGLLVPALYVFESYSECVCVVFSAVLYASLQFRRNFVWKLPMLYGAIFVGVPMKSTALWCALLGAGDVGRTVTLLFSGFDMYFSGTVLYVVSRYLFLLRVLWATFHEGPMEDKWNMTAAGLSCMVILAHDYKVVERMVHHIRL